MLLTFKRAFTDLDFYLETSKQNWKTVLAVFLVGLFGINLINGTAESLVQGPQLLQSISHTSDTVIGWWPENQVMQWQNQTLLFTPTLDHATVDWPLPMSNPVTAHLAYYQTDNLEKPAEAQLKGSQDVLFVLTPHNYWLNQLNGTWSESLPIKEFPFLGLISEGTYNKAAFAQHVGELQASLRKLMTILIFLWPFLSVLLSWFQNTWFVIIESTLVFVVIKLLGWKFTWTRLTKLGFLLMIPATTVQFLANWLYPNLTWSLFHVTYWIILTMLILLRSKDLEKPSL